MEVLKMNKTELIEAVRTECESDLQSKAAAERVVNAVLNKIADTVVTGEDVRLDKFGTFELVKRAGRSGVNPQTGDKIKIKATKAVKFKPAKFVKDAAAASKAKL